MSNCFLVRIRFCFLLSQLEKKLKQLNESLLKADKEYLDSSKKAESARQEHESAVYKVVKLA